MINQSMLRAQIIKDRKQLSENYKQTATQQIAQKIINSEWFDQAKSITAYIAIPGEVDLSMVMESAWSRKKTVFLPVVVKKHQALMFCPYAPKEKLIKDVLGMLIPNQSKSYYVPPIALDCVLMPLVAFDKNKNRVGMGGGYYDRSFAQIDNANIMLCGVAFDIQKVDAISTNSWDIKPYRLITEKEVL